MERKDRVPIVTGGGTGIGRAVCLRLARAGAAAVVVNSSRSEDEAKTAARDIEVLGAKAVTHRADVASEPQVISMIEETMSRFGRLDVLVNNAGTTHFIPHPNLDALTDDVWNEILSVNLKGTFFCCRAAAPHGQRRPPHMVGRPGYSWWPGGELTFGLALISRQHYCLQRPRGKRSRGQEQVARPVPALERRSVGVICFRGGDRCPLRGPTPLLGHAGWRLEGGVLGGRPE